MKKLNSVFVLTILVLSARAQVKLEDCQLKARNNYPLIKQFELIEQSRDYNVSNANKAYLPQLSITAIGGVIDGMPQISLPGSTSEKNDFQLLSIIQFNQVIWDGGVTRSRKDYANSSAMIDKAGVEVDLYKVEERVNDIFFGILLIQEQKVQLELRKKTLEQNREKLNAYVQNGVAFASDLDEIDYQILSISQSLTELEYNRSAYVQMLSVLVGEEIPQQAEFEKPVGTEVQAEIQVNRPEMKLFDSQLEALSSRERMNKSKLYPKLGIMGFGTFLEPPITFGTADVDHILVAGLSLSWDIGGLYQNGNDKKLIQVDYDRITNRKETFLFATNLEMTRARSELQKLESLQEKDKEMLVLKTRIKDNFQSRFDNGSATTTDLLNAINDEAMAKQNLNLHEMQYLMALYQFKLISGN